MLKDFNRTFVLKTEQRAVLDAFIEKKDVFALLPTGFGKSLIYQLPFLHVCIHSLAPVLSFRRITYVRGKSGVIGLSFDTAYSGFDQ